MIGDEATALVEAVIENADKLGLKWELRPGTVALSSDGSLRCTIVMDGDTSNVTMPAYSIVGRVLPNDRVMVLSVPPQGNYIIGWYAPVDGPESDKSLRAGTATQITSSSSFSTLNVAGGSPATLSSFRKYRDSSRLKVDFSATLYSQGSNTTVQFGVNIDGTDYDTAYRHINPAFIHSSAVSFSHIEDVPAGTYDITARWRRAAGGGVLSMLLNESFISFSVREVA